MIDLRANCVLHLKCNDNDANKVVLNSMGAPHGTSVRDTNLMHAVGKINGALSFDGTSDYIIVPSNAAFDFGTDDFSICFWMKLNTITPEQIVICRFQDAYHYFYLRPGSNKLCCVLVSAQFDAWSYYTTITVDMIGKWVFVSVVKTSAGVQTYFNSVPATMTEEFKDGNPNLTFVADIRMGCTYNGYTYEYFLNASLDNVMLFNKALTQAEIDFLYNNGDGTERLDNKDYKVYRGQDGAFDYENPVAEMALDDEQVSIPNQDLPPNTIWHYIRRRVAACCEKESPDSPACIVRINSAGEMLGSTPNAPTNLAAEGLADGKIKLRWRYVKLEEEIAPSGFYIYIDSGAGFDFENPDAIIPYHRGRPKAGEFDWTSESLTNGEIYRFCVRSYRTGAGESQNTDFVSIVADSVGPAAIVDLFVSVEEI